MENTLEREEEEDLSQRKSSAPCVGDCISFWHEETNLYLEKGICPSGYLGPAPIFCCEECGCKLFSDPRPPKAALAPFRLTMMVS